MLWVILAITLSISAGFEAERRPGERASALARYTLQLDDGATGVLVNTSLQGNTGYLGMPLCAALLGTDPCPRPSPTIRSCRRRYCCWACSA